MWRRTVWWSLLALLAGLLTFGPTPKSEDLMEKGGYIDPNGLVDGRDDKRGGIDPNGLVDGDDDKRGTIDPDGLVDGHGDSDKRGGIDPDGLRTPAPRP